MNLDVGLLTVAGVSREANVQPAHLQAISCSPMLSILFGSLFFTSLFTNSTQN
jgi:hypothetical protein